MPRISGDSSFHIRSGNLLVSAEHLRLMRQIQSVPPYGLRSWLLGVGVSLVLAMLGIAMAVYLVFVGH
jgi:hypothetical protein